MWVRDEEAPSEDLFSLTLRFLYRCLHYDNWRFRCCCSPQRNDITVSRLNGAGLGKGDNAEDVAVILL